MPEFGKVRVFIYEIGLGFSVIVIGALLLALLYAKPDMLPWSADLWSKGAFTLLTIGGTVCSSGFFRMMFADRVDKVEKNILDGVGKVEQTILNGINGIMPVIMQFEPKGISRVDADNRKYQYLYWRTNDRRGKPVWLRFDQLSWTSQAHPFETAKTFIHGKKQEFICTMVQLQGCLVVIATRVQPNGELHWEMAGLNFFDTRLSEQKHLFGHVRHQSMGNERQTLSSCILSTEELSGAEKLDKDLDVDWLDSEWARGHAVTLNLPALDKALAPTS